MALPLFAVAVPVLHSSGAWIASTAAGGYIAGTLSSTWVGALVLGNAKLFSTLGVVSAAGLAGALGGTGAVSAGVVASGVGALLTKIGLGGVAVSLGWAAPPAAATFLGLTPIGWAVAGVGATFATMAGIFGFYFSRKIMRRINEERGKGGLGPLTVRQLFDEVRVLERLSKLSIFRALQDGHSDVQVSGDGREVTINGSVFSVDRLKYIINKDGSEEIVFMTKAGRKKRVLLIRPASAAADVG